MGTTFEQDKERQLLTSITEVARILSDKGRDFNQHLVEQFKGWSTVNVGQLADMASMPQEHLVFYEAVAQSLGWLQQIPVAREDDRNDLRDRVSPMPVIYLRVLLGAKGELSGEVGRHLEELLSQGGEEAKLKRPRRLLAVIAGLETWARVELPDIGTTETLDLEEVQRLALDAGGRARWTALAPLKMYSLSKRLDLALPRAIFPPMGRAVSRGIERLFGLTLGESDNDYKLSRGLHLKLADLVRASVWDINSGFYRLGGGS